MKYIPTQSYWKLLQSRTGAIAALNTQTNQTYLCQGAINKFQFQFLSFTASLIAPCNSYCVAFNPIAIGTAKIRGSDTGAWRAAMGIAEFFTVRCSPRWTSAVKTLIELKAERVPFSNDQA